MSAEHPVRLLVILTKAWTVCGLRGDTQAEETPKSSAFKSLLLSAHGNKWSLSRWGHHNYLQLLTDYWFWQLDSRGHCEASLHCHVHPHPQCKWRRAAFSCQVFSGHHLVFTATVGFHSHCHFCLNTHNGICVCVCVWQGKRDRERSKHAWNSKTVMFHSLCCQHE